MNQDKFSNPETKEISRNIYNIKKQKTLSVQKIKEIEKDLFELEKNLSKLKKYYMMILNTKEKEM